MSHWATYDENGELVPRLAASIPTVENGEVSAGRTAVTWEIGVETELKDIDASELFGGDPGLDSVGRFYADIQMYTSGPGIDPQG